MWRSRSDRHREKEGGGVPAVIEAEGTTNQDIRNGDNVSSSWDIMEDGRIETGRDEALGTEAGFVSSESKPVIVYFSEDVIHRFSSREGSSPSAELDNVSTLEEETTASISYVHEADEEVGLMGGNAPSTPIENRECTTVLGGGVGSDEEIKMKSDKYEMNSITTDGHQMKKNHERMASESVIHQPPDTPQSHEIKMDRPDIQFPSIVAVTPTYSPTDSAHIQPHSTKCTEGAASMDESSAIPKIPLLNIIVATPTKYPDRRAESMLAVESDAMQKSPGVFCVPDLSDDEDSCGRGGVNNAPEMRSIFRQGQYNYDAEVVAAEVGGISEIQACASSDTEVASNIDGLKEQMDSFFVESPRNVPSPFLQYLSDAVNNDVSNSTEWDVPLQKVESYKSTTDKSLSSHVSYFSYEDVSIASDELETCAICLCPYEEGDVRIFSKRCPHGELWHNSLPVVCILYDSYYIVTDTICYLHEFSVSQGVYTRMVGQEPKLSVLSN